MQRSLFIAASQTRLLLSYGSSKDVQTAGGNVIKHLWAIIARCFPLLGFSSVDLGGSFAKGGSRNILLMVDSSQGEERH